MAKRCSGSDSDNVATEQVQIFLYRTSVRASANCKDSCRTQQHEGRSYQCQISTFLSRSRASKLVTGPLLSDFLWRFRDAHHIDSTAFHHSKARQENNSSWSSAFSVCDRLHGTLRLNFPNRRSISASHVTRCLRATRSGTFCDAFAKAARLLTWSEWHCGNEKIDPRGCTSLHRRMKQVPDVV